MKEKEAIEILKKVRRYYNMHRPKYDEVIKWLEGRERRKKKNQGKLETEK